MNKQIYPIIKRIFCKKCGRITNHCIYDRENRIYKCLICKMIHA